MEAVGLGADEDAAVEDANENDGLGADVVAPPEVIVEFEAKAMLANGFSLAADGAAVAPDGEGSVDVVALDGARVVDAKGLLEEVELAGGRETGAVVG